MSFPSSSLGNLTRIRTGKLDANAADPRGKYPFFTCAQKPLTIDRYAYDCDAILVAGNGDLNVKHYKGKFDAYQRTYIIEIANESKLDSRYLYYFMSKYVEKLRKLSIGGVIKYIKLGMLTDAQIPLPPVADQKRIAAILDKVDAIRHKRQQAINLTDEFLRSVFLDMFGDPVKNPKGLHQDHLDKYVTIIGGGTPNRDRRHFWEGRFPWVSPKDMKSHLKSDSSEHISESVFGETPLKKIPANSVLLVVRGMILAHTIPIAMAVRELAINQDMKALIPKNGLLPQVLLWGLLVQHRYILSKVSTAAHGTRRLEIEEVKSLPILIPPTEKQISFAKLSELFEEFADHNKRLCTTADLLYQALLQKAFRGGL